VLTGALQIRDRFLARFCEAARARLRRSQELLAAGAFAHAAEIRLELYSLAGEAAFLGCTEVYALARQGEAAARRIADDPAAAVGCTRAVRALGRALDALEADAAPGTRTATAAAAPAIAPPRRDARGRVLVVDDSKLSADLLAALLVDEGFAVETANDGPGLERALSTFHFDLALSDVNMPDLDCALVCRRVREVVPRARVVLVSGLGEDVLARECQRVSADGYVPRERGLSAVLERVITELAARLGFAGAAEVVGRRI
jgi:CheY-like chemotaxis protein